VDTPLPVSVLIVNYNGARHLRACLSALAEQTVPRYFFEVILVDNASRDQSVALIRNEFPWVRLVESRQNTGFAEGNNLAARYAHGEILVLLNNDTIPDPYWLEELLRARQQPGDWVVSKLVFADDPMRMNSAGLYLLRDGRGADLGFRFTDAGQYERTRPVFAGCGAALARPRPPEGEDLFDHRYFVYYEDLDAGWRHQLQGGRCIYAPRSLVRHVHGATAGDRSSLFYYYVERNRALTALRNADAVLAVWTAMILLLKVIQAFLFATVSSFSEPGRWVKVRAVASAFFGYLMLAPTVFFERTSTRSGPC
jgi:GT2 family glycosyltransferase